MSATRFPNGVMVGNRGSDIKTEVVSHTKVIPINFADGTTETDTSFTFPETAIAYDVYLYVRTAEATGTTKTVDVGTSTGTDDPDGLIDGASVASMGLVGTTLLNTGQTRGALLRADESGAGVLVPQAAYGIGGDVVSWTPGSSDFAELDADIIIVYDEIVTDIRL